MKQEKRKIESVSELVNALEKGVKVENEFDGNIWREAIGIKLCVWKWSSMRFRYAEPVEVVELYGWEATRAMWWDSKELESKDKPFTVKQTQIIQNGKIIWTETEENKPTREELDEKWKTLEGEGLDKPLKDY